MILLLLLLILVLILLILILLILVLLCLHQQLGICVIILRILIIRIQSHSLTVTIQCLLVLLLRKIVVAEVKGSIGTIGIRTQRVGSHLHKGLLRLIVTLRTEESRSEVVSSLKGGWIYRQSTVVVLDTLLYLASLVLAIALAHQVTLRHLLRRGNLCRAECNENRYYYYDIFRLHYSASLLSSSSSLSSTGFVSSTK